MRLSLASGHRSNPFERLLSALLAAAGVSLSGTGFHRRVAGPQSCRLGRGGSAVQRPYVTPGAAGGGDRGSAAHLQWGRGGRAGV